jgi:carbamoyl-phosphate synthase large subunit
MRILLSSIGRRGYLVKYFKQALGKDGEIWGADSSSYAPALHFCDRAVLMPRVSAPQYIERLLVLCKENKIDMVVPLIDPELEVLAASIKQFCDSGLMAVVSPEKTIEITFDKYKTYLHAKKSGIPVPETVLTKEEAFELIAAGKLRWPLIVKPRKGSASMFITRCSNESQLKLAFETCPEPMIQEFAAGEEYGYDLFCDKNYKPVSVFCKRKLAMRAGETDKAVSTNSKNLIELGLKVAEAFPIFGPADIDFKTGKNGPLLLEINPRFGGGYPCSHLCGADFPAKLIAMRKGQSLKSDIGNYPDGVYMFKQDEIISPSPENIKAITEQRKSKS